MAKILYVEDNDDNIYMLKRWLKRKGHEVLIAENGADGVDIAEQEMPDLILMDLNLPIMDGWAATTKIKENEKTSSIPVIALLLTL